MVRNKATAFLLASSMILGSVFGGVSLNVYADDSDTESVVSSSGTSYTEENTADSSDEGSETAEADGSSSDSVIPETEQAVNQTAQESNSSDTGSASTADPAQSMAEADSAEVEEAAKEAANETQAPQETVGVPGVAAPDLSWVSPAGIISASYTTKNADGTEAISDAVRKSYRKADFSYAIARNDNTLIYEEKSPAARVVGTIDKNGVLNVLKARADYLYVESGNVRGYVLRDAVVTGADAQAVLDTEDISTAASAKSKVKLEENAAADDFEITVFQFEKATGEDLVKYAQKHMDTVFNEQGDSWEYGLGNKGFIDKVTAFYNLYDETASADNYASYGQEITESAQAQAGDVMILSTGEISLFTGNDSVLLCSEEERGVCEKKLSDVTVTMIRRPDYEKQTIVEPAATDDDTLIGSTTEEQCWNYLTKTVGMSETAAAGAMGNIKAECGFQTGNLENWVNSLMNCSDEQFTAAVDTGVYTYAQFLDDKYTFPTSGNGSQWGYGLIGFTSRSAKAVLWANTVAMGRSLSDLKGQLDAVVQIYGEKLNWISSSSVEQAAADWFYYIGMGNPLGGTQGYGYEYTIPSRAAYAAEYYAQFHS